MAIKVGSPVKINIDNKLQYGYIKEALCPISSFYAVECYSGTKYLLASELGDSDLLYAFDIYSIPKIDKSEVKHLWHDAFYKDNSLSGMCEYNGEKYYYTQYMEEEAGSMIYALLDMPPELLRRFEYWHNMGLLGWNDAKEKSQGCANTTYYKESWFKSLYHEFLKEYNKIPGIVEFAIPKYYFI